MPLDDPTSLSTQLISRAFVTAVFWELRGASDGSPDRALHFI